MRHLIGLILVFTITVLQGCGGASNRDQLVAQTPTPTTPTVFFTTAPSSITFLSGSASGAYTISGGLAPYAASSSNASVAAVSVSGSAFTVVPGLVGSATVMVLDSTGTKTEIAVTVGSNTQVTALRTTAASAITLGNGGAGTFSIAGGVAPYVTSSSNSAVAASGVSGSTLSISGGQVAGTAQILVIDATGTQVVISVTVGSVAAQTLFTSAPSAVTLSSGGGAANFTVGGGMPPYAGSSSNAAVASASVTGTTLTVTAVAAGTTQILVIDSDGTQVLIGITVGGPTPTALFLASPATVTLSTGAVAANYAIGGGTPPYSAQSSNAAVVNVTVSGASLGVSGLSVGNANVVVFDSTGAQVSLLVNVSANSVAALGVLPSGASGNVGDVLTFTAHGGSTPYALVSNNTSIATLSTSSLGVDGGSFTATLLNVGETIVTVRDALGQTSSFVVSVASKAPQLRVSPSTFVVGENELGTISLNVFGGTAPYRVLTSDLVKSSVSVIGSTVFVNPGTSTNRCINPVTDATPPVYILGGTYDVTFTVIDNFGASAISIMTIRDNGAGLNLGCP